MKRYKVTLDRRGTPAPPRPDRRRQGRRPQAGPRPHPAQGRRRRRRPRLARRPDRRGPGGQHRHRRAGPPAVRRAGPRRRPGSASRRSDRRRQIKLDGRAEARLIALACSAPPRRAGGVDHAAAGRQAGRAGGRRLDLRRDGPAGSQKNELKPHLKEQWCIPPEANAEFVCAMEDVLEVYHRPYDEKRPLVCLDEASKQLIGEVDRADPGRAGPARAVRLRVHPQRHGQPVHGLRAAGWAGGR